MINVVQCTGTGLQFKETLDFLWCVKNDPVFRMGILKVMNLTVDRSE